MRSKWPERIIDPGSQPDTHIERRHGVKTRRELTVDQHATDRRSPPIPYNPILPGIALTSNGSVRTVGSGTPEGVVLGNVGDQYIQTATNLGIDSLFWIKASGAATNTGWLPVAIRGVFAKRRVQRLFANPGETAVLSSDFPAVPTLDPTRSSGDDGDGILVVHTTGSVSGNVSGMNTARTVTQRQWHPSFSTRVKTGSSMTSIRLWVGLSEAALNASDTPVTRYAAFRYSSVADGVTWKACTDANTGTPTVTDTGVNASSGTSFRFRIEFELLAICKFYIDDVLVATHTSNLPSASAGLGEEIAVTTLTNATRSIGWGWTNLEQD